MTRINTDYGVLDTKALPREWDPCFCSRENCGQRIGWYSTDHTSEPPVCLCDDCAALVSQGD